jgi:hypothetical protein
MEVTTCCNQEEEDHPKCKPCQNKIKWWWFLVVVRKMKNTLKNKMVVVFSCNQEDQKNPPQNGRL